MFFQALDGVHQIRHSGNFEPCRRAGGGLEYRCVEGSAAALRDYQPVRSGCFRSSDYCAQVVRILDLVRDNDERGLALFLRCGEDILHRGVGRGREFRRGSAVLGSSAHGGHLLIADFLDHCAGFLCQRQDLPEGSALLHINCVDLPAGGQGFGDGIFAVYDTCFLFFHSVSFIYYSIDLDLRINIQFTL